MEVICINDQNIDPRIPNKPIRDNIYSIRQWKTNPDQSEGVLLNEIVNPKIVAETSYGRIVIEPNFSKHRFTTLSGDELVNTLTTEMVIQDRLDQMITPEN